MKNFPLRSEISYLVFKRPVFFFLSNMEFRLK